MVLKCFESLLPFITTLYYHLLSFIHLTLPQLWHSRNLHTAGTWQGTGSSGWRVHSASMQGLRNGLAVWNRDASIDRSDRTILILWSTKDPQKIPHVVVSACFHMMPCFAATIRLKTFATQELPYADISLQPPVKTGHILIWIHLVPISCFPSNCSSIQIYQIIFKMRIHGIPSWVSVYSSFVILLASWANDNWDRL